MVSANGPAQHNTEKNTAPATDTFHLVLGMEAYNVVLYNAAIHLNFET